MELVTAVLGDRVQRGFGSESGDASEVPHGLEFITFMTPRKGLGRTQDQETHRRVERVACGRGSLELPVGDRCRE